MKVSSNTADATCWPAGRHLETAGLRGLHSPAGAHHHPLHRLPRPYLQQLLHVSEWEGRGGSRGENWLLQLRWRALVGGDHCHYYRIRRHCAQDMDGEDCCLLLLSVRHQLLCSASRNPGIRLRSEGSTEAASEALQPSDSSCCQADPECVEMLCFRQGKTLFCLMKFKNIDDDYRILTAMQHGSCIFDLRPPQQCLSTGREWLEASASRVEDHEDQSWT